MKNLIITQKTFKVVRIIVLLLIIAFIMFYKPVDNSSDIVQKETVELPSLQTKLTVLTYPQTSTNKLNTIPTIYTEPVKVEFVYDENIPLNEQMQYWVNGICQPYGIDPYFIYAIMQKESYYGKNTVSADGKDYGIMQIRQINHGWLSTNFGKQLNFNDDFDNSAAGIYFINRIINKYQEYGPHRVLMVYNMGEKGAQTAWDAGVYQTKYSKTVMDYYNIIRK